MGASRAVVTRRFAAVLGAVGLALASASAFASHGSSVINLTTDNIVVEHDGAVYAQGGVGAGTGTFDPFLTLSESPQSPASQAGTEDGYNQCDDTGCPDDANVSPNYYDQFFGGGRTHELLVSAVPTLEYDGALSREFSLDANDQGSDTWMSIDQIKIFTDSQVDLTGYDNGTESFSNDTGTAAHKVFDMDSDGSDDQTILMISQGLESGSGVSDVTVLVPNSVFPEDCAYGSADCDQYLYFWSSMGHYDGGNQGVDCNGKDDGLGTCDWNVTAGFEEWRVRFLPVVNVEKTAQATYNRDYTWTIDKSVTPTSVNLFDGAPEADVDWTITPHRSAAIDSDFAVSGTITITNPTGASPIPTKIDAVLKSVEDVLTLDGTDIDVTSSLDCGVTFPYTLKAGESLECTYQVATPDATATSSGENVATATINSGIPAGDGGIQFSSEVSYDGSADVDFSQATPVVTNDTATVTDPTVGVDEGAVDGQAINVDGGASCADDEGTHENTATVTPGDGGPTDTATASYTVTCYQLSVSKDANTSFDRDYSWTIEKSVTPTSIDLFNGAPEADVDWTITPHRSAPSDTNYAVSGTITITNPAPMAAEDVSVTDLVSGGVSATVDCDPNTAGNQTTVDVPANSSASCTYGAALSDDTTRSNTATATLFEIGYDSDPVSVDFSTATITTTDDTATVTDPTVGVDEAAVDGQKIEVDGGASCPGDSGTHNNTATVTEDDSGETATANASYTVTCYGLSVEKTATTTFTRDYDWSIAKARVIGSGETDGDGDPATLTLDEGETYTANYQVVVTQTTHTDSDWAVHGTITVSNSAPMAAEDVAVSDLISPDDIAATVDCDPNTVGDQGTVDVPAEGSAECSYSSPLDSADARTNVATATLYSTDYDSSSVNVTFDNTPDVEIDECVVVTDDHGTPGDTGDDTTLGTVCLGDLNSNGQYTFSYTLDIGPYAACGTYHFINTAAYATQDDENDTTENGASAYDVTVEVPCPAGCTLTQGYWKTHNDSFWGGAPTDETWLLIGPAAENTTFYLSGQTYFQVMWTAPKGNAYYNLAHQYIAAQLNVLDGADDSAIQDAFADATDLFNQYTPAYVASLKGKSGKELRSQFITLAGILGSYNEGLIGPGHCDEDATSGSADAATLTSSVTVADRRTSFLI